MEYEFQLGDRVELINADSIQRNESLHNGSTGTVAKFSVTTQSIGIAWDDVIKGGHDLRGACKSGHGWWVPVKSIAPLETPYDIQPSTAEELFAFLEM